MEEGATGGGGDGGDDITRNGNGDGTTANGSDGAGLLATDHSEAPPTVVEEGLHPAVVFEADVGLVAPTQGTDGNYEPIFPQAAPAHPINLHAEGLEPVTSEPVPPDTAPPPGAAPLEAAVHETAPPVVPSGGQVREVEAVHDDSADALAAELEQAKQRVEWLQRRAKEQKEKELAKEKEVLKERIAAAERQMNEEQARLVELVPRRQDLALKSAAFGLAELREDQERWDLEKKLRYEAIATQEETYRSLSQKQERMQAILHEREIWFGAIQEEQERRKGQRLAAIQKSLDSDRSAHLRQATGDSIDTAVLAHELAHGDLPVVNDRDEVDAFAITEMINGRRQHAHERRLADMAAERKGITQDRVVNQQQTRTVRSRKRVAKSRNDSLSEKIAKELGIVSLDSAPREENQVDQGQEVEWLSSLRRIAALARGENASTQNLEVLTHLGQPRSAGDLPVSSNEEPGEDETAMGHGESDDSDDDNDVAFCNDPDMEHLLNRIREHQEVTDRSLRGLRSNIEELSIEQKWIGANHGECWSAVEQNMQQDHDQHDEIIEKIKGGRERVKEWEKRQGLLHQGREREIHDEAVVGVSIALVDETVDEFVTAIVTDIENMRQHIRKHINMSIVAASTNMSKAASLQPRLTSGILLKVLGELQDQRARRDQEMAAMQSDSPCTSMSQRFFEVSEQVPDHDDLSSIPETIPDDSEFIVRLHIVDRRNSSDGFSEQTYADYEKAESALFARARVSVNELALDKRIGGPSAIAFSSPDTRIPGKPRSCNLAIGTTTGATSVYRLSPPPKGSDSAAPAPPPVLLRKGKRPEHGKDRVAITEIKWSLDGRSSLITLDAYRVVRTFVLEARISENGPKHSRDVFPQFEKDVSVPGLSLRGYKITNKELMRHEYTHPEDATSWERDVTTSMKELYPCGVTFHPSMSMLGIQPSIMIATVSGIIVKWNHMDQRGSVVYGDSCASSAPGNPDVAEHILAVESDAEKIVRREFFESHRCRILLLDFLDFSSLTMVTLDEDGLVSVWPYSEEHFTGNMWFRPQQTIRLDLMTYDRTPVQGAEEQDLYRWRPGEDPVDFETLRASTNVAHLRYLLLQDVKITTSAFGERREIYTMWEDGRDALHTVTVVAGSSTTGLPPGTVLSHTAVPGTTRKLQGGILQAKLTETGKEMAILVSYSEFHATIQQVPERLTLFFFNPAEATAAARDPAAVRDGSGGVLPQRIVHPLTPKRATPTDPVHRPAFSLSPVMDGTGSDYAYILDYEAIFVYSVVTGQQLWRIDPLQTFGYLHQIVDIFVSQDHSYATVLMPVNKTLPLMRIHLPYHDEEFDIAGDGNDRQNTSGATRRGAVVAAPAARLKRLASLSSRWRGTARERRADVREDVQWNYEQGVYDLTLDILDEIIQDNVGVVSNVAPVLDVADRISGGEHPFVLTSGPDDDVPPYGTVEPSHWPTHDELITAGQQGSAPEQQGEQEQKDEQEGDATGANRAEN